MAKFETFKDVLKHYKKFVEDANYRRLTVWFDGYYTILDNHFGTIKKTHGHWSDPSVTLKEICGYYSKYKDEYEIELEK